MSSSARFTDHGAGPQEIAGEAYPFIDNELVVVVPPDHPLCRRDNIVLEVQHFPMARRWYAVHLSGKKRSLAARSFLDFILGESASG